MANFEEMKSRFNEQISLLKSRKGKNNQLFTREEYYSFLTKVKENKGKTSGKYPEEYQTLPRYDVIEIGGVEKLLLPVKTENQPIIYYTFLEENFEIIHEIHIGIGHGGRNRMIKEVNLKYKNITVEIIMIYLNLCDHCQKNRKFNSKRQIGVINVQSQADEYYTLEKADSSSSSAITDLPATLPSLVAPSSVPNPPLPKLIAKAPKPPATPRAVPKSPPLNPRDLYNLQWSEYSSKFSGSFHSLWEAQDLLDVTLAVEGQYIQAHKLVLSVCSDYFRDLFRINPCQHPIVILKDVDYDCMSALIHFMYCGEVQVTAEKLPNLLRIAQQLKVNGLNSDVEKPSQPLHTPPAPKMTLPIITDPPQLIPKIVRPTPPRPYPATIAPPPAQSTGSTAKKRTRYTIPPQVKVKVMRRDPPENENYEPQAGPSTDTASGDNTIYQETNHNYMSLPSSSKQSFQTYTTDSNIYIPNEHDTTNILETVEVDMIPVKVEQDLLTEVEPEQHEFEFVSDVKEELGYTDDFQYENMEESGGSELEGEADVDIRFTDD